MRNETLKVLILGAGFMGTVHANAYNNIPDVEILGFVDKNIEKTKDIASKYNAGAWVDLDEEVLAKADFIDICLPTWMHRSMAEKAFAAGKDVICEKPISIDPEDAKAIIKAADESGRKLMIAQVVRFWPEYAKLKDMLGKNEIINPKQITFTRYGPAPAWSDGNWMLRDDKSGGIIFDLTIHDIDFCIWALGMPKWVFAKRSVIGGNYTAYVNAILGYDDYNVLLESGFIYKNSYPFTTGFRIAAEDATYEYINKTKKGLLKFEHEKDGVKLDYYDADPYQMELEYFIDCLRKNMKPDICTGYEALKAIRLATAIAKSAKEERKLEVIENGEISN